MKLQLIFFIFAQQCRYFYRLFSLPLFIRSYIGKNIPIFIRMRKANVKVISFIVVNVFSVFFQQAYAEEINTKVVKEALLESELIVIDPAVHDPHILYQALNLKFKQHVSQSERIEIVFLNPEEEPLVQINNFIKDRSNLSQLSIVSHASNGALFMSGRWVDKDYINQRSELMTEIGSSLNTGADLKLYGCNLAAGISGAKFVNLVAKLTQLDVAASTDTTGGEEQGHNWELEYQVGNIESRSLFLDALPTSYSATLNHFRYGTMAVEPIAGESGKVRLKAQIGYTSNHNIMNKLVNSPVGTVNCDHDYLAGFTWGDGQGQPGICVQLLSKDSATNDALVEVVSLGTNGYEPGIVHQYQTDGDYTLSWNSYARSPAMSQDDSYWRGEVTTSVVNGEVTNASPVTAVSSLVYVQDDHLFTMKISGVDQDGDKIQYRWGEKREFYSGNSNAEVAKPQGMQLTSEGLITWDLAADKANGDLVTYTDNANPSTVTSNRWQAAVVLEDLDINGVVKSKAPLDFVFIVSDPNNASPGFNLGPDLSGTQYIQLHKTTTFTITAVDLDENGDPDVPFLSVLNPPSTDPAVWNTSIITQDPATGTATIEVTFTPSEDMLGKAYAVIFSAKDSNGITSEAPVNLVIVNETPIAQDDAAFTQQAQAVTIDVLANDSDPDGDPLTITQYTAPNGTVVLNQDGTISYTPDPTFSGLETLTYTISDGIGSVASANVLVTVNGVPVANDDAFTIDEDTTSVLNVLSNDSDPNGDQLNLNVTSPNHGQLSLVNQTLTYSPNPEFFGTDNFSYTISDGQGGSDTANVTVTVSSVNDAPVARDDNVRVNEDSSVNYAVLINDTDPENHTLSVSVAQPIHGQASVEADGSITYVPNADFNGNDAITYTIDDGYGGQDSAILSITVEGVNDAPVAVNDSVSLEEDSSARIAVLVNDSDIDGDPLTVVVQGSANGTASVTAKGMVQYIPNVNFNGSDSLNYTISDGNGGSASAVINLVVTGVNDAPVAVDDLVTVDEDSSVTVEVLANDSDVDNDALTVTAQSAANGVVTIEKSGSITYTPNSDFNGNDVITYTIDDGNGAQATAQLSISVNAINDNPVAVDDYVSVTEDSAVTFSVLNNDSDVDNDALTVSLPSGLHGSSVNHNDGTITYTPNTNFNGSDSIEYSVSDGHGGSAQAVIYLDVVAVNDAPVAEDDVIAMDEDITKKFELVLNDTDVEFALNPASTVIVDQPQFMSASVQNGIVTLIPNADFNGNDSLRYQVSDAEGAVSNIATVMINVASVNDAPRPEPDFATVEEDIMLDIAVLTNDTDIDDMDGDNKGSSLDLSSVLVVQTPLHGQISIVDGVVSYLPDSNYMGPDSFSYTVADLSGAVSQATLVTLNVQGINDAPFAVSDSGVLAEDASVTLNVAANDTDLDSIIDTDSVTIFSAPSHGTVKVGAQGEVTYYPSADYFGDDSFSYTIKDSEGAVSQPTKVELTITAINDAPRLRNDIAALVEDGVNDINVLGNDSDIDGTLNIASLVVTKTPENGTVSVLSGGLVRYTPNDNYYGPDSFSYAVEDDQGASSEAQVQISIDSINDAPLVQDDSAMLEEDSTVSIDILANDTDLDGVIDNSSVVITTAPSFGSVQVNMDGSVVYTPNADFNGADSFIYQVSDTKGQASEPALVSVQVSPVNDLPEITGSSPEVLTEGQAYIFSLDSFDIDGDALTFTVTGLPSWASFEPLTGAITGTPVYDDVGNYGPIVITVSDGLADVSLDPFYVDVQALDSDGDGIPDTIELQLGLDPFDGSDAGSDADGDGRSNLEEWLAGSDLYLDDVEPELIIPADLWIDATGLFTEVSIGQAEAFDYVDSVRTVCCENLSNSLASSQPLLQPGHHKVLWIAVDAAGNMSEEEQNIYVRPLISLPQDQVVSHGNRVKVSVHLNGVSPEYPLSVAYQVSGSAIEGEHHDLSHGVVVFEAGQQEASIEFNTFNIDQNEVILIKLDEQMNLGVRKEHYVTITLDNLPPEVQLSSHQNGDMRTHLSQVDGVVEIHAEYSDPNLSNNHTLDWSLTDSELQSVRLPARESVMTEASQQSDDISQVDKWLFDPSGLAEGVYTMRVSVTDDGEPNLSHFSEHRVRVSKSIPTLGSGDTDGDGIADDVEGLGDADNDGIPYYLDNISAGNVLPERLINTKSYLVECEPGVACRLGRYAISGSYLGAQVAEEDIQARLQGIHSGAFENVGGVFNIEAHELSEHSQSLEIVIPQRKPVPENAGYRQFIHDKGWFEFESNADNKLMSAAGSAGYCPPPGSDLYTEGLNSGDWCVQLVIEDGGVNDGDEIVNGMVHVTGCVIKEVKQASNPNSNVEVEVLTEGGGSSGGAMPLNILFILFILGLLRNQRVRDLLVRNAPFVVRALACSLLLIILPQQALAEGTVEESTHRGWFISGFYGGTQSSNSSDDINQSLMDQGLTGKVVELDDSSTSWKLGVGYAFNDNWFATVEYLDLGEVSVRIKGVTDNPTEFYAKASQLYPESVTAFGVNIGYRYRFAGDFSVLAYAGGLRWQADYQSYDIDNQWVVGSEKDGFSFYGGLGLEYALTEHFKLSVQWNHVELDDSSRELFGAGIQYQF
ncbi:Ig-like domain-containing protein [Shewanella sairae]|nr:Ig-like domain-containing protein [Shewanella sairae]